MDEKKNKEIKNQIDDDFNYKDYSIKFDISDYFNMFLKYKKDLMFILKNAGSYLKIILTLTRILIKIKEFAMSKHTIFNVITTIIGLIYFVWRAVVPLFSGNYTWDSILQAALVGILGYFAKLKKEND